MAFAAQTVAELVKSFGFGRGITKVLTTSATKCFAALPEGIIPATCVFALRRQHTMFEDTSATESYRRKMAWRRTPEERMRLFCELQTQAMALLEASPEAMEAFIRRNHHKRRQSEVERLTKLLGVSKD